LPFEVAILETSPPPTYQRIAAESAHLDRLGLTAVRIAAALGVTEKTVAKAIRWVRGTGQDVS